MATYLNYDDQGFIIGTRRLESGIKSIGEDTQEIIQILKSQNQINQTVLNRIAQSNDRIANSRSRRLQGVAPTIDPKALDSIVSIGEALQSAGKQSAGAASKRRRIQASQSTAEPKSKITSNANIATTSRSANSQANKPTKQLGSSDSAKKREDASIPGTRPVGSTGKKKGGNNPTGINGRTNAKPDTDRDEKGRFTAKEKSIFDSLAKVAKSGNRSLGSYGGAQDVDPLIASANEIKTALGPAATLAGKVGGATGKAALRAGRFTFSKYKSLKRKEPLPKEQARHNKQNEETLGEILKRMPSNNDSILGSLGRSLLGAGGRGGKKKGGKKKGGKFGKFGKGVKALVAGAGVAALGAGAAGAKGIGKAANVLGKTRVLAPLATAIGIGSLASQWGELDHKQKSEKVGSLAGGTAGATAGGLLGTALIPIPVVGTAIGAAVGGWIGSEGGEVLGRTASPHIQSWTNDIKRYNLPQKMEGIWRTGLTPVLSKLQEAAGGMRSWLSNMGSGLGDMLGFGGGGMGDWKVDFGSGLTSAKDGVTYKLGAKDFRGGVIDCSGWVDQLNKDTVSQIEDQLSPEAAKRARIDASGGAAGIIKTEEQKGHKIAEAAAWDKLNLDKLQAGMMIGESRGSHAKSRHKGIGHIVQIIEEDGVKYVSESTSAKGKDGKTGVRKTELSEYVRNLKGRQFGVTVVDPYKELRGQLGSPKSSANAPMAGDMRGKRDQAMQYFMAQGWTKEQAAGIVGNLYKESKFDHTAVGDSGKAYGLAQWHPDRQADFKKKFGKDIKKATYQEQLAFINYELRNGKEQDAGNKLKKAKTAGQAGAIVSEFYERPKAKQAEKRERAQLAEDVYKNATVQSVTNKTKATNSALGFSMGGLANNFMPNAGKPAIESFGLNLGASTLKNVFNIPDMPSIKTQLSSGGASQPIVVHSNNEAIGQNVSDRDLAHAITGGIGMMRGWD